MNCLFVLSHQSLSMGHMCLDIGHKILPVEFLLVFAGIMSGIGRVLIARGRCSEIEVYFC